VEQDWVFPDTPDQDRSAAVDLFGATLAGIVTFFYVYASKRGSLAGGRQAQALTRRRLATQS
jgi:hypothetical protein